MSNTSSKIDLLYLINQLKENGDVQNVMKIERIFLGSLAEDREIGRFTTDVQLDRQQKKSVNLAWTALSKNNSSR